MTNLRQAWIIVKSDFNGDRLKLLWSLLWALLFMGYMGGLTSMIIQDTLDNGDGKILADIMFMTVIPMLGITFSKRTMKYLTEDSYTRMLAYMRTLPIPAAVILCKRKLHAVFSIGLNGVVFFGLIYVISSNLRHELPFPDYLAFTLTWMGLALAISGLYIFIELLASGRAYFFYVLLFTVIYIGTALLTWLAGGNLILFTVSYSREWGLLSPLMWGTLILGTLSVQLFSAWTIHRLKSRDLV
ncbi:MULTISPECIES: hypothetical protein [unclassified Paenibacillus]|uniref:hypothetical protein n=1 Tax=unclassified Paenibacillus TaxID=185978 RepID=UPI00240717FC|nr:MULTISPECIES: hypothetical protein [unclassified Paenibacillus]MDF9843379.1 hypothetical protein [Paenibacillus sp. PastF-2]MDF9849967.1 hypothetical protein [Paenibacillus sp. PastM-2]MDF9856675.1 hypothetical protein [Paenibacillus sp. PastF-1]MDH6481944.1 hypothetical protein [Paenibacillus sp. PastH-2]MDH6509370.1 hypothetical protein [Paenibacillus sp. PastM-3]